MKILFVIHANTKSKIFGFCTKQQHDAALRVDRAVGRWEIFCEHIQN